ncbi:hypothetical protein [Nocardioides zhouii]|uniref:Uncharacterized protein n=1 Tax=Nocardioides zhouii TaxID=1168729 RepID=A0A4Q2SP39_9ACTN|nr:hypothetical protein [Nocardioides zhouii]RYC07465.1 hypothetical protein EUA94_14325 [Nocardioides zhouii]
MSTDIDWQHELDTSFGAGEDVPTGHYVAAGRTAVRRRRATSVALVAAMTIGIGAAWASGAGTAPRSDDPVATQPSAPTTDVQPTTSAREARKARLERMRDAAREQLTRMSFPGVLTYAGLVLAPGGGPVLERVPNPMGYTADEGRSLGIRLMVDGQEQYALLTAYPNDGSSSMNVLRTGDFDGWLAQAVRSQNTLDVANGVTASSGDTGGQPWLTLDGQGGLASARSGVVIVEVRAEVDLGDNFSAGATRAGVVRLLVDGRSEFAAYRVIDGTLDVIPGGGSFDSISAFITSAREQYASGAGLR